MLSLFIIAALNMSYQSTDAVTFHVSPDGNDAWSGKLARPNTARTDGPFASLKGARNAVRQLKDGIRPLQQ